MAAVYAAKIQKQAIVAHQQTCPIGDLLGADRESLYLEYKSTLRWDIKQQQKSKTIETASIKTIAGFANSPYGGTLLIGVADNGNIHGLEDDYNTFTKRGQIGDRDLWGQHLQNLIHHRLGDYALSLVTWVFHKIGGNDLARINVGPSAHPIYDHKNKTEDLLAAHPRQHPRHHRPQRTRPHHRHPLGNAQLTSLPSVSPLS